MKLAIFWPNWIGDAVMATPAVRALRLQYPQAEIVHVLKPYIAGVLEGAPCEVPQIYLDAQGRWKHSWLDAALRLRRERIDLAVLFPNSFRSALVAWLARCGQRLGYRRYGRGPLLTH